jgi:hypothetical protein
MNNGSTLLIGFGIPLGASAPLGVASVFPVGSNGCRLLRGNGDIARTGVKCGRETFTRVVSNARSRSVTGRGVAVDDRGLRGKGDGLRGPIGRLSDECCEVDRPFLGGESGVGVVD